MLSYFPSQTKAAKILWFGIVCLGFIGAGVLIGKSYKEWQESPIATSITTHPIDDLDFPKVTICPPRDSNTALYHDLVRVGNGSLSSKDKDILKKATHETLIEGTHNDYAKKMSVTLHMGNLDQVLQGFHSMPTPCNHAYNFKIKMWNLNGTITTPWFEGLFMEEYYQEDKEFLVVLELPKDIKDKVGNGSFNIELDIDTREEEGWIEEINLLPTFTFHPTPKTWSKAELACQKEGGHLASVTSDEVNQAVKNVARGHWVWLGGRKKSEKWTWSDNSVWGYSKFVNEKGDCVKFSGRWGTESGKWRKGSCMDKFGYVCQKLNTLKGKKAMSFVYTKDLLNISNFFVHYKYKTASQELLDKWRGKRMTGFRFSWKIENKNLPLVANISEVGRSIQIPYVGDSLDTSFDREHKAILTPPKDLLQKMGNKSLVIELSFEKSDKINAQFSGYKLYRERETWFGAADRCAKEGGSLASIHSHLELMRAREVAEEEKVWLGGRKVAGQWQWEDESHVFFENWRSGRPGWEDYLLMDKDGLWLDGHLWLDNYFLCQGTAVTLTNNGTVRIVLERNQLSLLPFQVLFKSSAVNDQGSNIGGFTLSWFLKEIDSTQVSERLPARQEDWKEEAPKVPTPAYKDPLLHDMIHFAMELRLQNLTKEEILTEVIHNRSKINVNHEGGKFCLMEQVKPGQYRANLFSKVYFTQNTSSRKGGHITDEDIKTGYELFHAMVFCPPPAVAKLNAAIHHLLSYETTRTAIKTILRLFHSGALTNKMIFDSAKKIYHVLVHTLDLQYGNILLATSTISQIETVERNKWPFFNNYTAAVKNKEKDFDNSHDIYQTLGKLYIPCSGLTLGAEAWFTTPTPKKDNGL